MPIVAAHDPTATTVLELYRVVGDFEFPLGLHIRPRSRPADWRHSSLGNLNPSSPATPAPWLETSTSQRCSRWRQIEDSHHLCAHGHTYCLGTPPTGSSRLRPDSGGCREDPRCRPRSAMILLACCVWYAHGPFRTSPVRLSEYTFSHQPGAATQSCFLFHFMRIGRSRHARARCATRFSGNG